MMYSYYTDMMQPILLDMYNYFQSCGLQKFVITIREAENLKTATQPLYLGSGSGTGGLSLFPTTCIQLFLWFWSESKQHCGGVIIAKAVSGHRCFYKRWQACREGGENAVKWPLLEKKNRLQNLVRQKDLFRNA